MRQNGLHEICLSYLNPIAKNTRKWYYSTVNKKKLLQQILNNQKNVKYNDFIVILEAFGFYRKRGEGSHNIYKNDTVSEIINIQNVDGEAKPYQIKQFLSIVEKYNLKMEE